MLDLSETISGRNAAVQLRREVVQGGNIQKRHEDWRYSA